MSVYGGLIIACWVVFGAVWLVTALGAKKTLWRGRSLQSLYLRIGIIVVLIVLFQVPGFERAETGSAIMISNPIINSVGVLLCALGVAVAVWARMHLGKNWGMPMSLKENPELVTTGPYAYVRNPIYSGVLLAMLGSTLVAGLWWLVLLVPFAVYFVYSAKVEEKIMLQEFPDRYPGYKKRDKGARTIHMVNGLPRTGGLFFAISSFVAGILLALAPAALAQTATTTLQEQANQRTAQISQLQAEIAQLQTQLDATTKQKQTLQSAVQALNLNITKLTKNIALTQDQISQTDADIQNISGNIATTTDSIAQSQSEVADTLRQLNALDAEPLVVELLTGGTLSTFFDQATTLGAVRDGLENHIQDLASLKTTLQTSQSLAQQKRDELAAYQQTLSQQKQGLAISRDSQNQLLQTTKDSEANYQAQIAQKKTQETQFEQDLLTISGQLHLNVNPGTLPPAGPELAWPLAHTSITQYFGNTAFATANPSIYNGHGHDGIDLAASPGTPVMAARDGVVMGTGNTDLACPGASFGKWIFIQHDDGLSTMYAHLSTILVSQGQQVTTGQVIAYSDTTGYATGPHLHFGVYATDGSEIKSWPNTNPRPICTGKIYTMPVATLAAYLNPLTYLPPLPK